MTAWNGILAAFAETWTDTTNLSSVVGVEACKVAVTRRPRHVQLRVLTLNALRCRALNVGELFSQKHITCTDSAGDTYIFATAELGVC